MSRLSDMTKTIKEQTALKVMDTEKQIDKELANFEKNFTAELQQRHTTMVNALDQHEQQLQEKINQVLIHKTLIGVILGASLVIIAILFLMIIIMSWKINNQKSELAELQDKLANTPLSTKILSKISLSESNDHYFIVGGKGTETFTNQHGTQTMKIKK